ncbi:MAG: TfoX/Sxy family protein [Flavobacteriaceae bacterium]|nr:TfoX/Sxy family protein [Flavobacteriaceae bacterium]
MAVSDDYLELVREQLSEFGAFEIKRMFGGIGLFKEGSMFGKIGNDTFRLKVDEFNQKDFEAYGMKPFYSEKKKKGMPYWEVPIEILNDKKELAKWAQKSYDAAIRSKK